MLPFQFNKRVAILGSLLGLAISSTFLSHCTRTTNVITENNYDSLQLAYFVEKDFPYIPTSLDARNLGPAFPQRNVSARTLALKLGNDSYASFDTDLMRWTAAWTGEFLPMFLMPQISYKDYFNKNNKNPIVGGTAQLATGIYPGWSVKQPIFTDIRPDGSNLEAFTWGALPITHAHWKGVFVHNQQAILHYTVGQTPIYEVASSIPVANSVAFVRTFRIDGKGEELALTVAEIGNGKSQQVSEQLSYIIQGANQDSVTAVATLHPAGRATTQAIDNRYLTVQFQPGTANYETSVLIWKGKMADLEQFKALLTNTPAYNFPDFQKGGKNQWTTPVFTQGKIAPDTAAFVTDQLTLPLPNPWGRNFRAADIAFWKDGRAAVVTFEGDVWLLENLDKSLKKLKWTRFATGIHEPLSIEIRDNDVFVFGKEGIVKLVDLNNDGMADFYENFSNVMPQSPESREWAADMRLGPDNSFYIAKGGALSNGPGYSNLVAKGFRKGSHLDGSILKISPDGKSLEVMATGLRGPYIGLHPKTGTLTATDQQGNFVPSTPIYLIKKGDYYGVPPTKHRTDDAPIAKPLTWVPHLVDRSAIGEAWVTSTKMGPLNENLVHFSFGRPGLLRVLFDTTSQGIQGGVSVIHGQYPAPTSKGRVNPKDELLYITGFNLWGSSSHGVSAILRMRYTGKTSIMPNHFKAGKEGVVLRFDTEISKETAENPANFSVKRWNYKRSDEYGSGHYKRDGSSGQERLPVLASYLGADRKSVFLLIPDMDVIEQMEVSYNLETPSQEKVMDGFWFTVNYMEELDLKRYQFPTVNLNLLNDKEAIAHAEGAQNGEASVKKGAEIFVKMACSGCHSAGNQVEGMYGPPMKGLFNKKRDFADGTSAVANEDYIRESLLKPTAKRVKDYSGDMPSYVGVLSDTDIESVILYIKSLQ